MLLALALLLSSPFSFAESNKVIVAVVDTGIDTKHPDFQDVLWTNAKGEHGYDFVTNTEWLSDFHGHGTHIAGIIAALENLKTGTGGVTHNVLIMPVRYYSESAPGSVNLMNSVKALNFAIDKGAQIINYSGGGPEYSEEEFQALKRAQEKGILIVSAAGNDHHDTDLEQFRYFPSGYESKGLNNIISVGALGTDKKMLFFSNFGKKSVDLAVSGEGILSTIPGGRYGKMTGTSQSTAFVSGVAAEILYHNPKLTPPQLKEAVFNKCSVNLKLPVRGGHYMIFEGIQRNIKKEGRTPAFVPYPLSIEGGPSAR